MFKYNSSICLNDILSKVSEFDICSFYLNINQVPCLISSPFRNDKKPSCGIYSYDGNKIYYIDFATKEKGNIYSLLMKMWNCSFNQCLYKIYKEVLKSQSNNIKSSPYNKNKKIAYVKSNIELKIKVRKWNEEDIKYWSDYGITLSWLKYAGIYPISHYFIYKNNKEYIFNADSLAYAYTEYKDNQLKFKIYQPLNKKGYKWTSSFDKSIISLWTKIPKMGNELCICSSVKDALCLWSNTGIPCISLQGEGYDIKDKVVEELKHRYKRIFVIYDNDEAGLADAKKLTEQTNFINIVLPPFKGGKDISDARKSMGKEKFLKFIKSLFTN